MTDANYLMFKATSNGGSQMSSLHKVRLARKFVNGVLQLHRVECVSKATRMKKKKLNHCIVSAVFFHGDAVISSFIVAFVSIYC